MSNCELITKSDEKRIVWGWASVIEKDGKIVVDWQGDMIEPEELAKAAYGYVAEARVGKAMHAGPKVAELIESLVVVKGGGFEALLKSMGVEMPAEWPMQGWWVGFKVTDDATWAKVKKGELRAFSIGGSGKRVDVDAVEKGFDENQPRAKDGKWTSGGGGSVSLGEVGGKAPKGMLQDQWDELGAKGQRSYNDAKSWNATNAQIKAGNKKGQTDGVVGHHGYAIGIDIDDRSFYATGKTGTNIKSGKAVMEYEESNSQGTKTGRRVWATKPAKDKTVALFAD